MKYAIISDIHGNFPAFSAVLEDAKAQGVDEFLMLGDYVNGFPWGNEVMELIRTLKPAVIIRGNGEDYIINLSNKDQIDWKKEQFKPVYWAYRSLSHENLDYLTSLPKAAVISYMRNEIHLNHSMNIFYRFPKVELFHSSKFRVIMKTAPLSHEEYLVSARKALLSRPDALSAIHALPKGIYLFGHNHIQFHMEYEGRLFVNPGSCGEPFDCSTTAAYTILEYTDNHWVVMEQRVKYDLKAVIDELRTSSFFSYAPKWCKVLERELTTGEKIRF